MNYVLVRGRLMGNTANEMILAMEYFARVLQHFQGFGNQEM